MLNKANVLIFTCIPSPYQVELFNAIASNNQVALTVIYIYAEDKNRSWKQLSLRHEYIIGDDKVAQLAVAKKKLASFDLIIFNYYQHPWLQRLLNDCIKQGIPWCFWGERPGYRRMAWLGRLYRHWKLAALHQNQAPIWGIGEWAISEYKKEFGINRGYFNFPYFSDLERFELSPIRRDFDDEKTKRFLYSGALIYRKGIDLLADAFTKLADEESHIRLDVMGDGDLRKLLDKRLEKHKDKVRFLGFQSWENLHKFYQQADILCIPSRYDGWGLVVPEGLASGLPVIGTDRTGAALEFIKTDQNGWLIPANDGKALYLAMKEAAQLPASELRFRAQLAKKSVADHSLADGVTRFHRLVQETIATFA